MPIDPMVYKHDVICKTGCTQYITYRNAISGGPSHGHGQNVKYGHTVVKLGEWTDRHTDRCTDRQTNYNTLQPLWDEVINALNFMENH